MSAFSERPGLREQLISALSNSQLSAVETRECALDRVAAFGAAQIAALQTNVALAEVAIDAGIEPRRITSEYSSCIVDVEPPPVAKVPAFTLEPHLAAMLLRVKYVGATRDLVDQAVHLFAGHLHGELRHRSRNKRELPVLLPKIAEQVIAEWMAGSCPACHGIGRQGATLGELSERLVRCRTCDRVDGRPSGMMSVTVPGLEDKNGDPQRAKISCIACCGRLTVLSRKRVRGRVGEICGRCYGLGHFVPRTVDRAEAIGVTEKTYQARWAVTFDAALRAARALDRRLIESMRKQLGREVL